MSNESYLADICAQIERIPRDIALQVGAEIFEAAVQHTRVDSGQAAANWKFVPYQSVLSMEQQQMMWGWGNVDPISPVGYKWAQYDNSQAVYEYQFGELVNALAAAPLDITGVAVYNPITVGFSGFAPGNDYFYEENSFRNVNIEQMVSAALERAYAEFNVTYG